MSAPRQPQSLRTLIALTLLSSFAKGNHGPTAKVITDLANDGTDTKHLKKEGYNLNTLKVQIAQVRNCLLSLMGIELPFVVRGKMTAEQKAVLDKRLANNFVRVKAQRLQAEYRKMS